MVNAFLGNKWDTVVNEPDFEYEKLQWIYFSIERIFPVLYNIGLYISDIQVKTCWERGDNVIKPTHHHVTASISIEFHIISV